MHRASVAGSLTLLLAATLIMSSTGRCQDPYGNLIARTPPRTPAEELKTFHLPPGFEIQLVAAEPEIGKPINLNFDDRGRIWITQSVEYPFPARPGQKPRDSVKILEDADHDGRAERITTFADGLNIPIGVLPIRGGAIIHSIPNIYRMLDTDDDGKADQREVLYSSIGFDDTHGMTGSFTWGFDGWLYACHGFANHSQIKARDGSQITLHSGNTYRVRPDGSHVEQFTHGQVNPFGLTFDPLGNLFSADCHTRPITMLLRGGYYQSFGKPDDGLGFAPEICDHDHGSTAICGIASYDADHFPPEYHGRIFIGNVATNRVNQDSMRRHGSTLRAAPQPDFLSSDDPWFRPVDIKLGPDGALYIADFYNRIIGHYEVPLNHPGRDRDRGRVWRVIYKGSGIVAPPRPHRLDWGKATVEELAADLGHANQAVRTKAANQLVERGGQGGIQAVRGVLNSTNAHRRLHSLWVLERMGAADDQVIQGFARDLDPLVRTHLMRVLAERKKWPAEFSQIAVAGLTDSDAFVQRAAADALGRHPAAQLIPPLLAAIRSAPAEDSQLIHTLRMSLRDQLRSSVAWSGVDKFAVAEQRLIADVAIGVPSPDAARYLLSQLRSTNELASNQSRHVHHIARHASDVNIGELLAYARGNRPDDLKHQATLVRAFQQGSQERGAKLPGAVLEWAQQVTVKLLASTANDELLTGAELAGVLAIKSSQDQLTSLARLRDLPEPQRLAALSALLAIEGRKHVGLLGAILEDASEPLSLRERAAQSLAGLNTKAAHHELTRSLTLAPGPLQNSIAAAMARSQEGADKLVEAVAAGKASARLLQERAVHLQLQRKERLREQVAKLTLNLPPADQRLSKMLSDRTSLFINSKTNASRGMAVFEKNCANCHQLAGKGSKIGPQLDGCGLRGLDRLLEDIVDPNRNVDQAFRSSTLVLKDGKIVSGLVLSEEGEVIVLADGLGKEIRVSKRDVEERAVAQLSPMPANLAELIPTADFNDLLSYLLAQRPGRAVP